MQFKSKNFLKVLFILIIGFLILPTSVICWITFLGIPIFFFYLGWNVRDYGIRYKARA